MSLFKENITCNQGNVVRYVINDLWIPDNSVYVSSIIIVKQNKHASEYTMNVCQFVAKVVVPDDFNFHEKSDKMRLGILFLHYKIYKFVRF